MKKPVPPRLEDFGLSQAQYGRVPRLLRHRFSEKIYSRLGFIMGAVIGLAAFWAFFNKMDSALHGWFFGIPIGFVVSLMAAFLSAVMVKFLVEALSAFQRRLSIVLSNAAGRAFLYDEAMEKHRKAMIVYKSQYR